MKAQESCETQVGSLAGDGGPTDLCIESDVQEHSQNTFHAGVQVGSGEELRADWIKLPWTSRRRQAKTHAGYDFCSAVLLACHRPVGLLGSQWQERCFHQYHLYERRWCRTNNR